MKRRVILLGPPGSGKGTIASRLVSRFGLRHLSTGHWFRREMRDNTAIGRRIKSYMDRGELVPDGIVLELMKEWLAAQPLGDGFLLDGFPRTLAQAGAFDAWLDARGTPVEAVIFCDANVELIVERAAGRRVCPQCGRVYHVVNLPPRTPDQCDECGVALIVRDDDTEPVMRKRFRIYEAETAPLVAYYERQGKLTTIDAAWPLDRKLAVVAEALKA
jgi:adenylate kinase